MKQHFLRITAVVFLIFGISACSGSQMGQEPDRDALGYMAQFLHQNDDGTWVLIPTSSKGAPPPSNSGSVDDEDGKSTTGENPVTVTEGPTGYMLINGTVVYPDYKEGTLLVEVRDIRSCESGLCPDFDTVPFASTIISQPGFFSLVVPKMAQAMFLTVSLQDGSGTIVSEEYLGIVEKRIDNLAVTF